MEQSRRAPIERYSSCRSGGCVVANQTILQQGSGVASAQVQASAALRGRTILYDETVQNRTAAAGPDARPGGRRAIPDRHPLHNRAGVLARVEIEASTRSLAIQHPTLWPTRNKHDRLAVEIQIAVASAHACPVRDSDDVVRNGGVERGLDRVEGIRGRTVARPRGGAIHEQRRGRDKIRISAIGGVIQLIDVQKSVVVIVGHGIRREDIIGVEGIQPGLNLFPVKNKVPIRVPVHGVGIIRVHLFAVGQAIAIRIRFLRVRSLVVFLPIGQAVRTSCRVVVICRTMRKIAEVLPLPSIRHPIAVGIQELVRAHIDIRNAIGEKEVS